MTAACRSHKRRFPDFPTAAAAALRVSVHLGPLRCYLCPQCGGWHLTKRKTWSP